MIGGSPKVENQGFRLSENKLLFNSQDVVGVEGEDVLLKVEQTLHCVKSKGQSRFTKADATSVEESQIIPKSLGVESHFLAA